MIKATFGLTETGSFRSENQDSYLIDEKRGVFAVADGLGGLPDGDKASQLALKIVRQKSGRKPAMAMADLILSVNEETRKVGFNLSDSGFGTTLTLLRLSQDKTKLELGHVGDSACYLVRNGKVEMLSTEHTLAARMVATRWEEASEAIPPSAHHTLTQCIGQDIYIDPQIRVIACEPGDRYFLLTDGITKPIPEDSLVKTLADPKSLEKICNSLTFQVEVAGSPDNYTIVAVELDR